MTIATTFDLTFACGHDGSIDLADLSADRRGARLTYLREKGLCARCFVATRDERRELERSRWIADRRKEHAATAQQWATDHGFQALSGSVKQVNFATEVRYRQMRALFTWAVEDGNDPAAYERAETTAQQIDQARWWLDQLQLITDPSDLLELLTAAADSRAGQTCENTA